ncbi:MAG: hypothetical protein AB1726_10690 [Planctomycetota bacterium]
MTSPRLPGLPAAGRFLGAILFLAAPVAAQTLVPAPAGRARLTLATGALARGGGARAAGVAAVWANTDWAGFYATSGAGPFDEWLDWGVVSGDTGSDIVGRITFGYGTTAQDPAAGGPGAALTLRFYDDAIGAGGDGGRPPSAVFHLAGLPGSPDGIAPVAWILDLDLAGGFEFRQDRGSFGFSLTGDDDDGGGQSRSGPLLCFAGDGAGGADANGQVDFFDIWRPDTFGVYDGTWNFGGPPFDFASWYLVLWTADAAGGPPASSTIRNDAGDTNPRVYSCSAPILGGRFTGSAPLDGHLAAWFAGFAAPLELPLAAGIVLVDFTDPAGELLLLPAATSDPAAFDLAVPIDLTLAGFALYTQAVRFGGGISLTNACDAAIGF